MKREEMTPADLGGTSGDEISAEVEVVQAVKGWRWFWQWVRTGRRPAPSAHPESWLEAKERENARKADAAVADACGESER